MAIPQKTQATISPQDVERWRSQGISDETIAEQISHKRPGFGTQLQKIRTKAAGDPRATSAFLNYYFYGDAEYSPEPESRRDTSVARWIASTRTSQTSVALLSMRIRSPATRTRHSAR